MIANIVIYAAFACASLFLSVKFVHMLQLESYQTPGYLRWVKENAYTTAMIPVAVVAMLGLWKSDISLYIGGAMFALTMFIYPKREVKKPLVFTARVLRLLFVIVLFIAAMIFTAFLLRERHRFMLGFLAASFLILPQLVMIANIITLPIQKLINLHYISDAKRKLSDHGDLIIIGVTGSYGKTSTKYFLTHLLSAGFNTLMTPESYNTPLGIVRTIREQLNATHQVFVCEMGARHVGDIKEICDIVKPRHGVLTSIGEQHMETFFSLENIISTKFELINSLPQDGIAFLADDNEHIHNYSLTRPAVRYGLRQDPSLDFQAFNISVGKHGTTFTIATKSEEEQVFTTPLIGRHNVENITAAIAVSHSLGLSLAKLIGPVRNLKPVPHRLEIRPGNGMTIIDDAYNSNPAGAKAALDTLALFDGLKILITPGMVELGSRQDELNKQFGIEAAKVCDYVALVGKKQTLPIAEALSQLPRERYKAFDTFTQAMDWARNIPTNGREKYVLLENDLPDNY